jgi:hypothetical protein
MTRNDDRRKIIEALHHMEELDFVEGSDDEAESLFEEESAATDVAAQVGRS